MNIESSVIIRRAARIACLALIAGLLPASAAMAQLPIPFKPGSPPPVLGGSVIPFNHGATGEWNQIYAITEDNYGNILFLDSANSNLFELAPGATAPTLLLGAGTANSGSNNCASLEKSSTYWNAGIAVDSANNLYVTNRYSDAYPFCRWPYNASTGKWTFAGTDVFGPFLSTIDQAELLPQVIYIPAGQTGPTNTVYFSTSSGGVDLGIWKVTVNVSTGATSNLTPVITDIQDFAASIAVDQAGNVYFIENIYPTPVGERVPGILEIPAGKDNIVASGNGSESTYVIPGTAQFTGIGGITFDAQDNLYFGSSYQPGYSGYVSGVFMIPNEGTPKAPNLNVNDMVMISPVSTGQQPLVDQRGFLWLPDGSGGSNWAPQGVTAPTCDTTSTQTLDATCPTSAIAIWKPGATELGSATAGAAPPAQITAYSVVSAGGTLILTANNSFAENDVVTFTVTNSSDPLYPLNGLSFYVLSTGLSSTQFEVDIPTAVADPGYLPGGAGGSTSATAQLLPYGEAYYTFNQAETPASFSLPSPSGNNFKLIPNPVPNTGNLPSGGSPTPPPACTAGATYPAFSPTETLNSQFSWCTLFVQLNASTTGTVGSDVQMLDSSGNVITGSNVYVSGVGQGAAISDLAAPAVTSIASSGLSQPEQIAVDLRGDTYVADTGLGEIIEYPAGSTSGTPVVTGLSGPTGVAVDQAGDIFVGSSSGKVYEDPFIDTAKGGALSATTTVIASGLGSQLSLAVDSMGDVFVADQSKAQVVEIPNPQSQLLRQNLPSLVTLTPTTPFTGPTAIATDNSGNVWVADGTDLWEFTMPYAAPSEITKNLPSGVTGLAIDPSGSVFVADGSGLQWYPYQNGGLNVGGEVTVAAGFGSNNTEMPIGVGLDGSENIYADYGSGSTAGLSELTVTTGDTVNFSNEYSDINPAVPYEDDAELFNLGNAPLTLQPFANDTITQSNSGYYSLLPAATLLAPPCSSSAGTPTGSWCYLGFQLLATSTGSPTGTATILTNATNATSGYNIALSGTVVEDYRPATTLSVTVAAATGAACPANSGGLTYPGCAMVTVTAACNPSAPSTGVQGDCSTLGAPAGTVTLDVPNSGLIPGTGAAGDETQTLNSSGVATYTLSGASGAGLLGGKYNILATYSGDGTSGTTPATTCTGMGCWAGSAYTGSFTIQTATPSFSVGPPDTAEGCLSYTATNCTPNLKSVTPYLGTDFVAVNSASWITASVTSQVGTPTGSVSFLVNGQPVDPTQPSNPLNASGIAEFNMVNLPQGVYTVTVQYNGDQNFTSESTTMSFEVINSSIEVSASPAALTAPAGTQVTDTLTLQPLVGFDLNVSLECVEASLPPYTECTFAYPNSGTGTVGVGTGTNSATPSTIVVTITTNVPVNSGATSSSLGRQAPWALAGLFGFGLLGLIAGRKRLNRYLTLMCVALIFSGLFMGLTSCTNASYTTQVHAPVVTTPAGTYPVQIIAIDPSDLEQDSLTSPVFTLPYTVTAASAQ